jgi:hypothetical protein
MTGNGSQVGPPTAGQTNEWQGVAGWQWKTTMVSIASFYRAQPLTFNL